MIGQKEAQFRHFSQTDIVTFGESMGQLIPIGGKGTEYSDQYEMSFAGAESNVAIGLARLGHRSGWFGRLGKDPLGNMILKRIRGEGVDVSQVKLSIEAPTGLIIRELVNGKSSVYYYRKNSAASLMRPEDLNEEYIKQAIILHITGITPALSTSCKETILEAVSIAKRNGVKVSFDPNLRLKLWTTMEEACETLLPIAKQCDYFFPGLDELKLLYQTDDFQSIVNQLNELQAVCVIKGAGSETILLENGVLSSFPYYKVERVVDTVGAGDGFCVGFLSGLLRGYSNAEATRLGNLVGSFVIQVQSDFEGLPTWEQVESFLSFQKHVER